MRFERLCNRLFPPGAFRRFAEKAPFYRSHAPHSNSQDSCYDSGQIAPQEVVFQNPKAKNNRCCYLYFGGLLCCDYSSRHIICPKKINAPVYFRCEPQRFSVCNSASDQCGSHLPVLPAVQALRENE